MTGSTRVVGLIGWPVSGSISPQVHNAAFAAEGMDWAYLPLPVRPRRIGDALAGVAALGFAGANVTMPHKEAVADRATTLSPEARWLRAVNTLVVGPGGEMAGHNTDAPGLARFLADDAAFDPTGCSALIYGAGGAARACALALARAGAARLVVAARRPERASAVLDAVSGTGATVEPVPWADARDQRGLDVVINATPLGSSGEPLPLPRLGRKTLVVDLLYRPAVTPLLEEARQAGAHAFGGLGLLVRQAALSFELWTGRPAPLEAMSAAALSALAEPT